MCKKYFIILSCSGHKNNSYKVSYPINTATDLDELPLITYTRENFSYEWENEEHIQTKKHLNQSSCTGWWQDRIKCFTMKTWAHVRKKEVKKGLLDEYNKITNHSVKKSGRDLYQWI